MRRTPGSGRGRNSPPPNDSKAPAERRVRRQWPKGPAREANPAAAKPPKSVSPFPSAKSDRFGKSAKAAKATGFDRRDKPVGRDKPIGRDKPVRFDRRGKPAQPDDPGKAAKSVKFNKSFRFGKPERFAERAAVAPIGPALRLTSNIYIAHTQPGFEGIAAEEIAARYAAAASGRGGGRPAIRELGRRTVPERAGMTIFSAPRPDLLSAARTIEDLFTLVGYRDGLGTAPATLEKVRTIAHEAPYVEEALESRVRMTPGSRAGRKLGFRVIARIAGEHEFRRLDFQRAVERGIADRGDRSWR
ncbi:MAG: hypothetical protein ACXWNU_08025, partial [Candidatus Binataceae bacterium]